MNNIIDIMKKMNDTYYPNKMTDECICFSLEDRRSDILCENVSFLFQEHLLDMDPRHDPKDYAKTHVSSFYFYDVFNESIFCRTINNFLKYLTDILIHVVHSSLDSRIAHTSNKYVIDHIINTTKNKIRYSNADELMKTVLDFSSDKSLFDCQQISNIKGEIKKRNQITHQNGIVDESFAQSFHEYEHKVGHKIKITSSNVSSTMSLCRDFVFKYDHDMVHKFRLNSKDFDKNTAFTELESEVEDEYEIYQQDSFTNNPDLFN